MSRPFRIENKRVTLSCNSFFISGLPVGLLKPTFSFNLSYMIGNKKSLIGYVILVTANSSWFHADSPKTVTY
ncbi:MAG: hypothetical protein JWQ63_1230 [Mucilaginibacter sp.]|nr:hypothetical protein [Mucilaginibacter sp.]